MNISDISFLNNSCLNGIAIQDSKALYLLNISIINHNKQNKGFEDSALYFLNIEKIYIENLTLDNCYGNHTTAGIKILAKSGIKLEKKVKKYE